jgi:hypothetical protein
VRAELEQEDVAAAQGELAGDDASTGARADDDDLERAPHAIPSPGMPRYDQSFFTCSASGELKSMSA